MTTETLPIDTEFDEMIERALAEPQWPSELAEVDARLLTDVRRSVFGMMRAVQQRLAEIDDRETWLAMITEEVERDLAPKRRQIQWLETQIKALAEQLLVGKAKRVPVPGCGYVQYVDREPTVKIADPEAFMAALGADERALLVEMQPKLRTADAKTYAESVLNGQGGEILPGVERIEARRTSTIAYEHAR